MKIVEEELGTKINFRMEKLYVNCFISIELAIGTSDIVCLEIVRFENE